MGKPFEAELGSVCDTIDWAVDYDLELLTGIVAQSSRVPLLVVGSGGSLSQAHFVARLHEAYTGNVAKAVTPLELVTSQMQGAAVLFLSAGGRNKDVLQAFKWALGRSWAYIGVQCGSKGSPLALLARKAGVGLAEVEIPTGRDGFLATNSLVAGSILFLRAYGAAMGVPVETADLKSIVVPSTLPMTANDVVKRNTVVALGAGWSVPAVWDLESKFVEAALGNVQIADLRNFAHGRHLWLAKRGTVSGVVICQTPDESHLADRTLALIPKDIPRLVLATDKVGPKGTIELLGQVFRLVSLKGRQEGIDPGRPGVPSFGSRIYGLGMADIIPRKRSTSRHYENWISRKMESSTGETSEIRAVYQRGLDLFLNRLATTEFRAIVFDYDGTLCSPSDRFGGLRRDVVTELLRLIGLGLWIGVASGRGKSVAGVLRECLPKTARERVLVGYYNGGILAPLSDDTAPNLGIEMHPAIRAASEIIRCDHFLNSLATFEIRPSQVSVQAKRPGDVNVLRQILAEGFRACCGVKVLESGHSWDLIPRNVSKLNVVRAVEELSQSNAVLCLGDRGDEMGNDHELLSSPFSLSVDKVSRDPYTCWNLADGGRNGVDATLQYLQALGGVGSSAGLKLRWS